MNTHCPSCGTHKDAIEGEIVSQAGGSWTCARCVRRKGIVKQNPEEHKLVPICCPACRGSTKQPNCMTCSGHGQVRMPVSALNVYDPSAPAPRMLTED